MSYVNLHTHSDYSLLDGASQLPQLIDRAAELGMPAIALTDHGVMYGALQLIKLCRNKNIKAIIGNEMYVINGDFKDKKTKRKKYHQIVLAKNTDGYKNLVKLTTISHLEGFQGKGIFARPCINKEALEKYREGLIVSSGCLAGEVPQNILKGDKETAKKVAKWYKKIFGEDYYLEIQDHGYPEDRIVNVEIVKIAKELKIKVIATNDSHFTKCQDVDAHDALLCINTQKLIIEEKRMRYSGTEYLKSAAEMKMLFRDHLEDEVIEEAIANTLEVAEKIKGYDLFGDMRIPNFPIPSGHNPQTYLEEVTWEGLQERLKVKTKNDVSRQHPEYEERLKYELSMIEKMGFSTYFLVVWDYIKFARDNNIPVGPGRGSAAGSLVAYALKITNIDPVHHGLLFERFLNPERKSMPDIDTDFSIDSRDDMIKYVTEKYGEDKVAQIVTFNRMTSKAVLKDVARVLGVPYGEADKMAKLIPVSRGKPTKLKVMVSGETPSSEFKEAYDKKMVAVTDPKGEPAGEISVRQWIDMAIGIEGTNRTFGVHAAGVLISKDPLDEIVPLQRNNDGAVITQYFMEDLETLGLLKMDFLGLRNLTIIQKTTKAIAQNHNLELDAESLPADERRAMGILAKGSQKKLPEDVKNTYKLIASGDLEGVFQLESSGMIDIVKKLKPSNIEDISSILALYRPGPLDAGLIPKFIDRKHGREEIRYDHSLLEPILNETYGVLCLPKGTLIDKSDGSMVAIENVGKGDTILTSDGSRVWEAKVARQWRSGVKEILKIVLSSGTIIFAGKNHRFLTPEGDKFAWELKSAVGGLKNAHIYASAVYEKWPVSTGRKQLRQNEAYLLGLLIGNGNLVSSTPNIACPTEKGAAWVANLIYETWGGEAKYYFHTRCWYAYSKFNTQPKPTPLTEFMDGIYGGRSWKVKSIAKHLPEDILDYSEKDRIDLLRGLWDSDGSYGERLLYYRSSSIRLLEQVGRLLGSLNISYYLADNYVAVYDRFRFISILGSSQLPNKQQYEVRENYLPVSSFALATKLEDSIRQTDSSTRKTVKRSLQKATLFRPTNSQYKTKLKNWDECYRELYEKTYLQDARLVYVVSVEEAGEAECFDLEMEDQSSPYFLAQGVVVHNCYQEQIMKMAQDLAGYSLGQADLLRRCLSGDTEVVDAATGNLVKISEIADRPEYWLGRKLFSLDLNTQEIVERPISEIHRNGRRLVWEITTRTNRKIKATQEHLFYTVLGWQPLGVLQKGDRLALAKQLPIINAAEIEKEIIGEPKATGEKILQPEKFASGVAIANSDVGKISTLQKDPLSNSPFPIPHSQKAVSFRFPPKLKPASDVFWDEIISIEYVGVEEVFDLSIPQTHNFVANDFVVHNCIGKKKVAEMEKHREMFIDGAAKKGVSSKIAQNLFEQMVKFAEYCFNKSHSTAYAYVSYQTAYLKANYPVEYMAALLTANSGDQDKVQKYIANCQRFSIEVEPPDINRSQVDFTPLPKSADEKGRILFGLSAVKNLGDAAIMAILSAREEKGRFACLAELCDRVNQQALNSRALESLIYCGAFDKLESNRQKLIKELPDTIAWAQKRQRDRDIGQLNLFDLGIGGAAESENGLESAPQKTNIADFSAKEKLNKEKELLGFYVSDHPLKYVLQANPVEDALTIGELKDKEKKTKGVVKVVAMVAGQKLHTTKKGDRMAFLQIEDMTGQMEAIIFPKTFEEVGSLLGEAGAVLLLTGKAETKDDEVQLLVEEAKRIQEEMAESVEKSSLAGEMPETGEMSVLREGEENEGEAIAPATSPTADSPPEEIEVEIEEHPAKLARRGRGDVVLVESLEEKPEKTGVKAIGKLTRVKVITTKKGDEMAFIEIEDETGKVDVTVFPQTYKRFKHLLEEEEEETLLLVTGKTEKREGRVKVTADKLELVAAEESSQMAAPPEEHFDYSPPPPPPEYFPQTSPPPPPPQTAAGKTPMSITREMAIVLQLTPQQVSDRKILDNLKMVLEEYVAKEERAVVPVMAMVVGKSCRQLVRFDRRFWVEDLQVVERLKQQNFNVAVSQV